VQNLLSSRIYSWMNTILINISVKNQTINYDFRILRFDLGLLRNNCFDFFDAEASMVKLALVKGKLFPKTVYGHIQIDGCHAGIIFI